MQQYGDGPEPAMLPGGAKRDWFAFEEHVGLPDEDAKRACTQWPEILETKPVPAMSISSWGPWGGFEGAMHQPEPVNFTGGGIYQDFGLYGGYSTETTIGPLSLSSFLWSDSDTAPPVLGMGNGAGYLNYDANTYSGSQAQHIFPSFTLADMSWNGLDIGMETGETLPFQDPGGAAFKSESSVYKDLGVICHDRQAALDQVVSVLPQSVDSQSVLLSTPQRDDLTSNLVFPCRRGALPGSAPIPEETRTRTSGGYARMDPSTNSQEDPSQATAAQGPTETSTIDHNLGRNDLSGLSICADTESDQITQS
jgi:hypothetical protein